MTLRRYLPLVLLLAACSSQPTTSVQVHLSYDPAWNLSGLQLKLRDKEASSAVDTTVRLLLPDEWANLEVPLFVVGKRDGEKWATGRATVTPVLGRQVDVDVALTRIPCGAWCTAGSTICDGNSVVTCAQLDADQCLEWAMPTACPASTPFCSHGVCGTSCVDECVLGEKRCDGPSSVKVCGEGDTDSCADWLPAEQCADGETCSNGVCSKTCKDECQAGATACLGAGTVTCGDLDSNGCLEWGPVVPCTAGQGCSGGACAAGCTDECTANQCDGNAQKVCGQFDLDPCKDLSPGVSCIPADPCLEGACVAGVCKTTALVCNAPPPPTCVDSSTRRTYSSSGMCTASGDCSYAHTDAPCPTGCAGGTCNGDPCIGVVCATPPAPTCINATTRRTYNASGTCSMGTCDYAFGDYTCSNGCAGGGCRPPSGETVSAGLKYSCGVKTDGTVTCWGYNAAGQGTALPGSYSSVSAGDYHACGVKTDGTVACWGRNDYGQATAPAGSFSSVSAGSDHTCGVKTDGTLTCWGKNDLGQAPPAPAGSFSSVSAGFEYTCGLKTDATVTCWGRDGYGQGTAPPGSYTAISAGFENTCGLKTDATVACWGRNIHGEANAPPGSFSSISAGDFHTCGLKTDGAIACWGGNSSGQTTAPPDAFSSVSAGDDHTCGVRTDGIVVCWGDNFYGQTKAPPDNFKQ